MLDPTLIAPSGWCYPCSRKNERVEMEEVVSKLGLGTLYVACPRCKHTESAR